MQRGDRRSSSRGAASAIDIVSPGHAFFSATMILLGIQGLVLGAFPPTWAGVPAGFPGRAVLAYLCALVSLGSGMGLLFRRHANAASRLLLASLLDWLLLVRMPRVFGAPATLDTWWGCGDTAVMTAGAWILYVGFAGDRDGGRLGFATGEMGLRIARALYGLAMVPFGVAHFLNLEGTAALVPGWMPWHPVWASFTGCAFLAVGLAVIFGALARPATALSALQLGLFTLLVWGPAVAAGPDAFQWSEFVDSWALTAGAWVVADSYRGTPWLAVGRR